MSTHKNIDRICVAAVVLAILLTSLFVCGESLGIEKIKKTSGYETRLFDTSKVHTIDITMDDWESFIDSCQSEEYTLCNVVIDGEAFKNVAIRGKGNTSLSNVSSMNSQRYSFKIEFDHYNSADSYYGLDKLSLNNIIQDNTYMKDYLTYQLMNEFGVNAPLCSYVYITVGGEAWGLYLAVEGVEDAFLSRNYGNDSGNLYKPDSMSFGGGRGNGRDFDIADFTSKENPSDEALTNDQLADMPEIPDMDNLPDISEMFDKDEMKDKSFSAGGMGSDDVKLKYIDDDISSYSNIFDNAKTDVTSKDKTRLIESLKSLSDYENIENVVDVDKVIRYFVVHNYVCNGDSYTGSMVHNYYLYEKDGQLSMIPWDYNLAFGGFQSSSATDTVNSPIDSPVSGGDVDDRPMIGWIFSDESYTEIYHEYFADFIENVDIQSIISDAEELISDYVEKDPTKFCTYDEYIKGIETLKKFCSLRSESILGQLNGSVPSSEEAQKSDKESLVDASDITISDMGTMGMGGKGDMGGMNKPDAMEKTDDKAQESTAQKENTIEEAMTQGQQNQSEAFQGGGEPPEMPGGEMPQQGGNAQAMQAPPNGTGNMGMPEGSAPGMPGEKPENMNGGMNPMDGKQQQTTEQPTESDTTNESTTEQTTKQDSNQKPDKSDKFQNKKDENMPGSSGNMMQSAAYILGSFVLLALGIIFAVVFKRRKS